MTGRRSGRPVWCRRRGIDYNGRCGKSAGDSAVNETHQYQHLLADYWSPYKGLFLKDPRKIRAEWIYAETVGEDARTPEGVAADFDLPVEAVLEAIHYCTHNEDFLRREREEELARIREHEKKYPPLVPPGYKPEG